MSRLHLSQFPQPKQCFHGAVLVLILLFAGRTLYFLVKGSSWYLFFVTDDFFYYLIPAQKFVATGRFTFDGITLTNGFHPLWMLTTVLMWLLSFNSTRLFFVILTIVLSTSAFVTIRLIEGLIRDLELDSFLSPLFIGLTALVTTGLIFIGMEIALTIPLYLCFLRSILQYRGAPKEDYALGLVTLLLIMSRLETAILLLAVLVVISRRKTQASVIDSFARVTFVLTPIFLLVYVNVIYLGTPFPVSSLAKQLVDGGFHFNRRLLGHLLFDRDGMGALLLLPGACFLLYRAWRTTQSSHRFGLMTTIVYPIVFYGLYGATSDWFCFRWYFYPLPALFVVASCMLAKRYVAQRDHRAEIVYLLTSAGILLFGASDFYRHTAGFTPEPNSVFKHATLLQKFVASHPGLYAMGDRAGLTAFICNVPMLQLEGISSDLHMIENIRTQSDLLPILKVHGVRYLIESGQSSMQSTNGCYTIFSPHESMAGGHSLAMHTQLRQRPIFHVATSRAWGWDTSQDRIGEVNTNVFEIH